MKPQDQLELERIQDPPTRVDPAVSTVKTILLHVQDDSSLDQRLQSALSLARSCEAHLSCLHVTPIEAYVAFDSFGGVFVMSDVIKALDEGEANVRSRLEERLGREDVSWDYVQITGNVISQIISHAALADLIVVGRDAHRSDFVGPTIGMLGDLLYRSRTPLFVTGSDGVACDPTGTALVLWDGSYEAANAVRSSIGLLKLASNVMVLQIEDKKEKQFPSTRLLEYLSRQGIHADARIEPFVEPKSDDQFLSEHMIARAESLDRGYIVMGGYNHSRIGEYMFGGVTRYMLANSTVPIIIAH